LGWTWDEDKNRINKQKHGISFETAQHVFDGRRSMTENDPYQYEERFRTMGRVHGTVILVVHTWPEGETSDEFGRIITARKATRSERLRYEESGY
jgi:hypothetical protein